jgi:hypothetical protein
MRIILELTGANFQGVGGGGDGLSHTVKLKIYGNNRFGMNCPIGAMEKSRVWDATNKIVPSMPVFFNVNINRFQARYSKPNLFYAQYYYLY